MTYWQENDPPMSFVPEGWSLAQKRKFRYECIPYLPGAIKFERFAGKRVLCIGDGSGIDAVEFARAGALVCALDLSEKAVELTKKHAVEAGVHITAWVGGATDIDLIHTSQSKGFGFEPTGFFDAVYSFGVLHHIPEVEKAIAEIARVLRPGGLFVGMVYHRDSLLYAYSILARAAREGISADEAMQRYSERNPGCPCSRAYSIEEWRVKLDCFSSCEIRVEYNVVDLPEKRKVPFSLPLPSAQASKLGWHLFFEAVR